MSIFDKYKPVSTGLSKSSTYESLNPNKNMFEDYKSNYSVMGKPVPTESEDTEEPGILSDIASGIGGFATGASQKIYEGAGNLVNAAGKALDYINPINITSKLMGKGPINLAQSVTQPFANASKDIGFRVKQTGESMGADTEGFGYSAGKFTGELASQVPAMVFGGSALNAVKGGAPVKYLIEKLPNVAKVLGFATKSIGSSEIAAGAQRGEGATSTEVVTGLAIDGAASLLSYLAPKMFKFGAHPDAPGVKNVDKFKEADAMAEEATGKYMGTKRQIISQAENVITRSGNKMRSLLSKVAKDGMPYTGGAPMLTDAAGNVIPAKLKGGLAEGLTVETSFDPYKFVDSVFQRADEVKGQPQVVDAMLKQADDWLGSYGKPMNPVDLLEAKQDAGDQLAKYFKKGVTEDLTITGRKQALVEIWKALSDQLDTFSPEIKKLNREMSIAYAVKGPLAEELDRKSKFAIKNILTGAFGGALFPTVAAAGMQKAATPIATQAEKNLLFPAVQEMTSDEFISLPGQAANKLNPFSSNQEEYGN